MKKGALKGIVCLVVIVVIWMAVSFRSKPLSDEGEISLENFVVCRVQMMEIKNDTGYVSGAEIREKERMQKALDALGEIVGRKMIPWEKLLSDRQEQETYYTMMIWYDSETEGRYESLACWEGGRIDFRDTAYMITGKEKTKATDLLEGLCRNTKQQNKEKQPSIFSGVFLWQKEGKRILRKYSNFPGFIVKYNDGKKRRF